MIGKASNFDGPMTPDEMMDFAESLDDGVYMTFDPNTLVNGILGGCFYDYVDFENASCSFDGGEFEAILNRADKFRECERLEYEKSAELTEHLRNDTLMLLDYQYFNNLYQWVTYERNIEDSIVNVGYPNAERKVIVNGSTGNYFAVTETSLYKALAVDFLEVYMALVTDKNDIGSNAPYYRSDVERQYEYYSGKTIVRNGNATQVVEDELLDDSIVGDRFKITREDADNFMEFLDNVDAILRYDTPVYQIFQDERFSGVGYSNADLVKILQSRASIFMSEQLAD